MSTHIHHVVTAFLNGATPLSEIDHATWRSMVVWAKSDLSHQVAKIERLCADRKFRLARRTATAAIHRLGFRFAVAEKAVRNAVPSYVTETTEDRRLDQIRRMTILRNGIANVGCFRRPASPTLRMRLKPDGTYRPTLKFDWTEHAQQLLLSAVYTPFADFHSAQYQRKQVFGPGGTAAVREALLAALDTADETDVFLHLDVSRFYDNIRVEWLERKLWLPREVIRGHAHTADMIIRTYGMPCVRSSSDEAFWMNGRLGLPQGSALSPLLADLIMAEILRAAAVPKRYPLFVWSDNIGVLVPRREAATIEELFRTSFAEHGAGPFTLTASHHPVSQEFKFVGHWFRRFGGRGTAYVPHVVANAWVGKIFERLSSATSIHELRHIERHSRGKLSQWAWWPGCAEYRQSVLSLIEAHRDLLESAASAH